MKRRTINIINTLQNVPTVSKEEAADYILNTILTPTTKHLSVKEIRFIRQFLIDLKKELDQRNTK